MERLANKTNLEEVIAHALKACFDRFDFPISLKGSEAFQKTTSLKLLVMGYCVAH